MSKETIRIGVIGAGFARGVQIPGFKNCPGAQIVAISSARREHAAEVAREFDIEHVEGDWRQLVARDDVDLVTVVTPVVTHYDMTMAALEHGKAVLCEKPMAMNAGEAERMTERAREAGVLALIDHELRFLPSHLKLRELVRQGEIGKVHHARLSFRADFRSDPNGPWTWWSDAAQGGGALGAIGSHIIDALRWVLETEVTEVMADLVTRIGERKDASGQLRAVTTDDEANLLLRFGESQYTERATGNTSMSLSEPGQPGRRLGLFGSLGALMLDEGGGMWQSKVGEARWRAVETDPGELAPGMAEGIWSRGFTTFSKQIIAAMREGATTVEGAATFEDGYRIQLVLDAARRANQSGCWVKVS